MRTALAAMQRTTEFPTLRAAFSVFFSPRDMLTKAQTASKNLQQNAAVAVAKMLNDTENYYSRNLQSIKVVKGKLSTTLQGGLPLPSTKPSNNNPNGNNVNK